MLPKFKYHRRLIFIAALLFLKDLQTFAQKEFLVTVNPSNGAVTRIDSIPGVTWIKGYETPAYCESKQRYRS
jgi:hypothetical protein